MQKVITVSLDTKALMNADNEDVIIKDLDAVNAILLLGWEIQEWEILRTDDKTGRMLLWVVFTDEIFEDDEDEFDLDDLDL